uniref:Uncharacterized protein n=1 Tax=Grammatophora oceanica TaxID=210454 RepID=A0A7S1YM72_9STRA|mmetsp:Transcript_5901/g.8388  ORF Transcript_5901/g.8388 Transcript_5901/m.8388 type:complete len:363 (+) Transcript_5901:52-1140(+)|eukprot:CAMPEP_0194027832 /NCGR_PEP_ID=MMETSP0009_2-20130614/1881_1 /TAXON_ID=210454 /ORGANISM="Grammatophora oceanica, Strain CCMP 410" /LENGTH=362 /DNA_ID=CAMNT_0038667007 /DNA_START=48 /DNA_END=1136 /DNA_ORIENTATION=-
MPFNREQSKDTEVDGNASISFARRLFTARQSSNSTSSARRRRSPKVTPFVRLLQQEKWDEISAFLTDSGRKEKAKWLDDAKDFLGQTALHMALKAKPPLDVVDLLMSHADSTVQSSCTMGWTPLHIAAGWGSGSHIVARLLQGNSRSKKQNLCRRRDLDGRTPLHMLCLNPNGTLMDDSRKTRKAISEEQVIDMVDVARILVDAYPNAIVATDEEDKTPVDYAIEKNACSDLIALLEVGTPSKKAGSDVKSSKEVRKMQKKGRRRGSVEPNGKVSRRSKSSEKPYDGTGRRRRSSSTSCEETHVLISFEPPIEELQFAADWVDDVSDVPMPELPVRRVFVGQEDDERELCNCAVPKLAAKEA